MKNSEVNELLKNMTQEKFEEMTKAFLPVNVRGHSLNFVLSNEQKCIAAMARSFYAGYDQPMDASIVRQIATGPLIIGGMNVEEADQFFFEMLEKADLEKKPLLIATGASILQVYEYKLGPEAIRRVIDLYENFIN